MKSSQDFEFHEIRFNEKDEVNFNERNEKRENLIDLGSGETVREELILSDFPL